MKHQSRSCTFLTCCIASGVAQADVVKYTNKAEWQSLVGTYSTITFTEFVFPAIITDQYSFLGVTFTDGNDALDQSTSLINDGVGLYGNFPGNAISIAFAAPITSFAIDHPGHEAFTLFSKGEQIFDTGLMGGVGTGKFSGVISNEPFDAVVIKDPGIGVTLIDDMHFGPPIPAPGAICVLAIALLSAPGRRRRL